MPRRRNDYASKNGSYSKETQAKITAARLSPPSAGGLPSQYANSAIDTLDTLVGRCIFEEGRILRVIADRSGTIWTKVRIQTSAYPNHYLLTAHPPGTPLSVCLAAICEKVLQFEEGSLRPSLDKWSGD